MLWLGEPCLGKECKCTLFSIIVFLFHTSHLKQWIRIPFHLIIYKLWNKSSTLYFDIVIFQKAGNSKTHRMHKNNLTLTCNGNHSCGNIYPFSIGRPSITMILQCTIYRTVLFYLIILYLEIWILVADEKRYYIIFIFIRNLQPWLCQLLFFFICRAQITIIILYIYWYLFT